MTRLLRNEKIYELRVTGLIPQGGTKQETRNLNDYQLLYSRRKYEGTLT
jgi:hypothetical protein